MTIGSFTIDGGQFVIGQDSLAPIVVTGNMTISQDGLFSIGRDLDESLSINGNLVLETGGQIFVGRNLNNLTVNGNIIVNPSGSGIVVNGALGDLTVSGIFQGQGGTSTPTLFDLGVGLTISGLTISGGTTSQNSLINANIRAGGEHNGRGYCLFIGQQHDPAQHSAAPHVSESVSIGSWRSTRAIMPRWKRMWQGTEPSSSVRRPHSNPARAY